MIREALAMARDLIVIGAFLAVSYLGAAWATGIL
jgi:hypothetical protein